jgi:nicotinate-nucleotide adenylyltransferase
LTEEKERAGPIISKTEIAAEIATEIDLIDGINGVERSERRQRVAIFGGTFDPIHNGHYRVAESVLAAFAMDRLYFVPAFVPPHKRGQTLSSPYHRLAMLVLATFDSPRMFVSTVELDSPTRPYTIETLQRLQADRPEWRLFFVMGADSFSDVTSWYEYRRILSDYDIIVATRPGYNDEVMVSEQVARLDSQLQARVIDLRRGMLPSDEHLNMPHIYLTDYAVVDVSATTLREIAAKGGKIDELVPPAVAAYIIKYGLYQNSE